MVIQYISTSLGNGIFSSRWLEPFVNGSSCLLADSKYQLTNCGLLTGSQVSAHSRNSSNRSVVISTPKSKLLKWAYSTSKGPFYKCPGVILHQSEISALHFKLFTQMMSRLRAADLISEEMLQDRTYCQISIHTAFYSILNLTIGNYIIGSGPTIFV